MQQKQQPSCAKRRTKVLVSVSNAALPLKHPYLSRLSRVAKQALLVCLEVLLLLLIATVCWQHDSVNTLAHIMESIASITTSATTCRAQCCGGHGPGPWPALSPQCQDSAGIELLAILHSLLLPKDNRMPNSLHLLRNTLGVEQPGNCEHQACKCEKQYRNRRHREHWSESGVMLGYPFCHGVRSALHPCLPQAWQARGTAHTCDEPGTWVASPNFDRLLPRQMSGTPGIHHMTSTVMV